uniref:RNA helicase n=1 Tax=Kalmanozyma brasiliensis (strain GHG001) TaxID=1365824 RepID=V5E659_KALBG
MSVSPFLTGNSIWSTNAPQTSAANNNHSSLEAASPLPNRSVSAGHIFDKPMPSSDDAALEFSVIKDMLDRLIRVESGMKDFSRQISGISRNVSLLLERTKGLPPSSLSSSSSANAAQTAAAVANGGSAEDMRTLNVQVNALASSVSHLLTLQNNGSAGISSTPALTGLGLGPTGGMLGTPQLGGLDRATSPRVGSHPNGQFPTGPNGPFPPSNALSPRPSISGNGRGWSGPNVRGQDQSVDRRWNAPGQVGASNRKDGLAGGVGAADAGNPPTPGLDDGTAATSTVLQPGTGLIQPNAIISKWDHLNLHPDLLRSILKYGLGPPNRIQQRALPFLLRGSDIIAQAPPTQERIASYVIPALQLVLNVLKETGGPGQTASNRGPVALIVSTTVDQATQAQRMALGLGAPLGIRVHMVVASSLDVHQEAQSLVQVWPHIVVGTPQKMSELFTYMTNNASSLHIQGSGPAAAAIKPSEVRLVVLDEVDQLIARNLADHVSTMLRVLPLPSAPANVLVNARGVGGLSPGLPQSAGNAAFSPFDQGPDSLGNSPPSSSTMDRQVALFSNTVPQDVLNFAQSIHLRESVRVLVRRDGAGVGGGGSNMSQGPSGGASLTGGSNSPSAGMQASANQRDASQPANALGAHPMNSSVSTAKDPMLAALKGMRQYYLYVAVTSNGGGMGPTSPIPGLSHNPAGEMKLDLISDLLEDIGFGQTVIYCANIATQEALIYKLSSKGIEAMGLNRDMNAYTRQQTLGKFRSPSSQFAGGRTRKALVVCEIAVNPKEVHQIPLIVFYDMPRSVEDYKDKISCAAAGAMARPSVCVNVVTASGGPRGDVEMLRTIECHFGCKMAELPMDPRQILNF